MIRASIDIGTNSVLLLVADVTDSSIDVLYEEQHVPRLGKNVDKDRSLHFDSQQRVILVLKTFKNKLAEDFPVFKSTPVVTATSAVRDASNRDEFLGNVERELGWEIKILSGDEEAETTYAGALSVLSPDDISRPVIIDIGGGSTEFAAGENLQFKTGISLNIGSVRFTERYFHHDPPLSEEIRSARKAIEEEIHNLGDVFKSGALIGVAGTVTSIAAIEMGLDGYISDKLNGYRLKKRTIEQFIHEFSETKSEIIEKKYPPFLTGRGEVILAGILILDEFMKMTERDELIISTGGIRHGILLK